jgi:hypothetical protein
LEAADIFLGGRIRSRFAKDAGFNNTLTAENSGACPMPRNTTANVSAASIAYCWSAQYRSPKNLMIAALEAAARATASAGEFSNDAVLFG